MFPLTCVSAGMQRLLSVFHSWFEEEKTRLAKHRRSETVSSVIFAKTNCPFYWFSILNDPSDVQENSEVKNNPVCYNT